MMLANGQCNNLKMKPVLIMNEAKNPSRWVVIFIVIGIKINNWVYMRGNTELFKSNRPEKIL